MTYSAERGCLPDVNVWIAIASSAHEHHDAAAQWFDSVIAPVTFCRVTQMAFLRLLTNHKVMGADLLNPVGAIAVYRQLADDERVGFAPEPPGIEAAWISLMTGQATSGSAWTDAYLAAFALESGFRLVSFDKGMSKWPALSAEILKC